MHSNLKLTESRLDVIIKMEYAWAYKNNLTRDDNWYYNLYKEHIRAINDFSEINNAKNNFSSFLDTFHFLINEFQNGNWDNSRDKIEISNDGSIRNGGHRFALTNLFGYKFCEVIQTEKKPQNFNLSFFLKRKLKSEFCHYALERYIKHSSNCHLLVLFPSKSYDINSIELKIKNKFRTIFTKDIFLSANGVHNLVLHMYRDQEWATLEKNQGYSITLRHAQQRFLKGSPVKFIFVDNVEVNDLHKFKKEIREELKKGNFPIHVPDTHEEVKDLANLVLRNNGLVFLNNSKPKNNKKVHDLMKEFKEWVKTERFDIDDFCIIGSAYVSLEGHREVKDLDIIDLKFRQCPIKNINIIKENSEWLKFYDKDIIFSPQNNFYYNGIRVLSGSFLRKFKLKRASSKDLQDLNYLKSNDEKWLFKRVFNYLLGVSLESSFWILFKVRTAIPKPYKKFIRSSIEKIFKKNKQK